MFWIKHPCNVSVSLFADEDTETTNESDDEGMDEENAEEFKDEREEKTLKKKCRQ